MTPQEELFVNKVRTLRALDMTWAEIGERLGLAKETVRTKFKYHTDPEYREKMKSKNQNYQRRRYGWKGGVQVKEG